jgi:hypothetical protein
MERRFDVRCYVENDVKLAAFAENRFGQGTRHRDLVYIDINDGIGAGIILDNRDRARSPGIRREIGYFLSAPSEMEYTAVTRGYLENRASVEALGRSAAEAIRRGVKTVISDYLLESGGEPRPVPRFQGGPRRRRAGPDAHLPQRRPDRRGHTQRDSHDQSRGDRHWR